MFIFLVLLVNKHFGWVVMKNNETQDLHAFTCNYSTTGENTDSLENSEDNLVCQMHVIVMVTMY